MPGLATGQSLDDLVPRLALGDFADRAEVVAQIGHTGDSRAAAVLDALLARTLEVRASDGRVVRVTDARRAVDPLSGEDLGPAGGRATTAIRVNNGLRRDIRTALGVLTLADPDPARRRAAAEAALRSPDPDQIDALAQAMEAEQIPALRQALGWAHAAAVLASDAPAPRRLAAVAALSSAPALSVQAALNAYRADPDPALAEAAIRALERAEARQAAWAQAQTLWFGISLGSVLLLAAIGLAITFGVMGVINLAHGEMVMVGAYTTVLATTHLGFNIYLCLPLAFVVAAGFGYIIEKILVRRLYGRLLDTLLATWGVALILQQLIRIHFGLALFGIHIQGLGSDLQNVPVPPELQQTFQLLGANVPVYRAFVFVCAIALGAISWWLIYRTRFGTRLRAVSVARNTAAACGINDKRVNSLAFAYGSGLAGVAGVLVSGFKTVSPDMGTPYVVDAFLVVVAGGVGHLSGTLAAAGILGQVQSFVATGLNDVYGRTVLFVVVILILLFKPQGLFVTKKR